MRRPGRGERPGATVRDGAAVVRAAPRRARDAGLVRSKKRGRIRTYTLAPARLRTAERWIEKQRALWQTRLDQLDAFLLEDEPT